MKAIVIYLILILYGLSAYSQISFSAVYDFTGSGNDTASFKYNGIICEGINFGNIEKIGIISVSSNGNFRGRNWSTNSSFEDSTKYISITINAIPNYKFTIDSIVFGIGRSGTGPKQWEWRGDFNNYDSPINDYTNLASGITNINGVLTCPDSNSAWMENNLKLNNVYYDIDTIVNIRLYAYDSNSASGTGGLQGNITIHGTFERLPSTEPFLAINFPKNDAVIFMRDVEIDFYVENFEIGTDGKLKITHNDHSFVEFLTVESIKLSKLTHGQHTVILELVDDDDNSLEPPVAKTVSFTCVHKSVYERINSTDEIDNGRYLFVGEKDENYYALGWQKTSNRHAVPVNIVNNTAFVFPAYEITEVQDDENPYEITILKTDDGFVFFDSLNNKFLRPATGNTNGLQGSSVETYWNVSRNNDDFSIFCNGNSAGTTYTNNLMRFNTGSTLFNCYGSSTQSDVYLYKAIPYNTSKLNAYPAMLSFEDTFVEDTSLLQQLNIIGYNLNDIIEVSLSDYDDIFIVDSTEWNANDGGILNICFSPKEAADYSAILTIKSVNAEDVTIYLNGKGIKQPPAFTINYPNNDFITYAGNIDVEIMLYNFVLDVDGKIAYSLNEAPFDYQINNKFTITDLDEGVNIVTFKLVDMDEQNIETVETKSITINYLIRKLKILSPVEGEIIYSQNIDIMFEVDNFDLAVDGKVKFYLNNSFVSYEIVNYIEIYDLKVGGYNAKLELVDLNNNSLDPPVESTVNFIIETVNINQDNINEIMIFPNPASLHIYLNNLYDVKTINIISTTGQQIYEKSPVTTCEKININNLSKGVYFIKIEKENGIQLLKFIKT